MIFKLGDFTPEYPKDNCFIAHNATLVGNVHLGELCSVWFGAVIRGDDDRITLGNGCNVQDGAVLHCDQGYPLSIGNEVTIGHKAVVHGCSIGDCSLIGINAVVLNGAKIGQYCLIGANALVTEGMEIPDGSVVLGSPGKIKKTLSEEQRMALALSAHHYKNKIAGYLKSLVEL